jgi:DmsE family decaheme c-type cytochrome
MNKPADAKERPSPDRVFGKKSKTPVAARTDACASCHKGKARSHWDGSQHQVSDVTCANCHQVHAPADRVLARKTQAEVCFACHKTERAQTHRVSTHPLAAGKMSCSDCHNPHGSTGPKLQRKGSVNETCHACHAEKRGPFLWEHQPATEDCSTCHTPHGSNIAPLLKLRTPYMCQACHTGDHAAQINSAANLARGQVTTAKGNLPLANAPQRAQVAGKNCLSCHSLVHGSNHPAGAKFLR